MAKNPPWLRALLRLSPLASSPSTPVARERNPTESARESGKLIRQDSERWIDGNRPADIFVQTLTAQFSPDGKHIVTSSADRTARVWNADTGRPLIDPLRHISDIISAEFSPDGKRALSASSGEHLVRVWDATTGKELIQLAGHTTWLTAAHFSHDGKFIGPPNWSR